MPLTQVIGYRGSGKTLFTTIINLILKKYYPDRLTYSNYELFNCKQYKKLHLVDLLKLPKDIELIMDEGYAIIHSRLSMSYINIMAGFLAFQLRKTNTNIFITMQQLFTIDKIYRREWDYRVYCERTPNDNENWREWDFFYEIHDKKKGNMTQVVLPFETAKEYFNYYDTFEIIEPRNKSRMEYEMLKSDKILLMKRAKEIAEKIRTSIRKDTREGIEHALLNNGFDDCWTKIVYLEHKMKFGF